MNILLVDDDFFFQMTLSFFLKELNHQTVFAQDGQKALDILTKNKNFDLVICDIDMPVMAGDSFISMLKKFYTDKHPILVIASGMQNGQEFLKKSNIAYDYYFKKPLDVNVFSKTLDEIHTR